MSKQQQINELRNRIYGDHRSDGSIKKKGISDHIASIESAIEDQDWNLLEYYRKEMIWKFSDTDKLLEKLSNHEEVRILKSEYLEIRDEIEGLLRKYGR